MNTNDETPGASAGEHVMRWTYDRDHAKVEAVCLAAPDADCRLTSKGPECDCERWGRIERRDDGTIWHAVGDMSEWRHGDVHELVPGDDCNVCLFINESGCAEELTPNGEHHEFVIADVPFEPVWENDGCSWRPMKVEPGQGDGVIEQLAAAWSQGLNEGRRDARAEARGLRYVGRAKPNPYITRPSEDQS